MPVAIYMGLAAALAAVALAVRAPHDHHRLPCPLTLSALPGGRAGTAPTKCVCSDQSLCNPLQTPLPDREILAFAVGTGSENKSQQLQDYKTAYRWDLVTTVAYAGIDNETVCWAHEHGARIVTGYGGGFSHGR
jgi:hypothetical protein